MVKTTVNEDVKNHYDDDKDFMVSYVRAFIVAALLEYFGMEDVCSPLTTFEQTIRFEKLAGESFH